MKGRDDGPSAAAFHAHITGRVQGVGFRYACCAEARVLGVTGWVKNTPEGAVEVWAEGGDVALERLRVWLHRGPPRAMVAAVAYTRCAARGVYRDFRPVDEGRLERSWGGRDGG